MASRKSTEEVDFFEIKEKQLMEFDNLMVEFSRSFFLLYRRYFELLADLIGVERTIKSKPRGRPRKNA